MIGDSTAQASSCHDGVSAGHLIDRGADRDLRLNLLCNRFRPRPLCAVIKRDETPAATMKEKFVELWGVPGAIGGVTEARYEISATVSVKSGPTRSTSEAFNVLLTGQTVMANL